MAKRKSGPNASNKGTVAKSISSGLQSKSKAKKSPFAVGSSAQQKRKPKEVKTQLKKIKAVAVRQQQESSDAKLKALHATMVVKQPAAAVKAAAGAAKVAAGKAAPKAKVSPAAIKATRQTLNKLLVK